ncbi:MAG TPA: DUF2470 domain-containing protein [Geodermatophilus sp.]|nr:DUF2470 domain-containing protein [Geodermatophilus sp.]
MDPHEAAVLARTALRSAGVAALTTYPRGRWARPHVTTVALRAADDGSAIVLLSQGSRAAQQLLARPFATVHVAPPGSERLTLHGAAQRLPGTDDGGRLAFRIEPGAVRLGRHGEIRVETAAYTGATADALGLDTRAVLAHLRRRHHAEQLAACVRTLGHEAAFAEAVRLDRHGLTVQALGPDGVTEVHLEFPAPVTRLEDLPLGLRLVLTCQCAAAPPGASPPTDAPHREAD